MPAKSASEETMNTANVNYPGIGAWWRSLTLSRVLLLSTGITLHAQFGPQDALNIMSTNDGTNACDQQHGADNQFYNAGCCGMPGNRECPFVMTWGKGPWGDSPGCADPPSNILRWNSYNSNLFCQLPDVQPEATNLLPTGHPFGASRDF